jgi:hypothetical protein
VKDTRHLNMNKNQSHSLTALPVTFVRRVSQQAGLAWKAHSKENTKTSPSYAIGPYRRIFWAWLSFIINRNLLIISKTRISQQHSPLDNGHPSVQPSSRIAEVASPFAKVKSSLTNPSKNHPVSSET